MDGASHFYIGCFLFGFLFSGISFFFGFGHSLGLHLPFGHGSHGVHGFHGLHGMHGAHGVHGAGANVGNGPSLRIKAAAKAEGVSPMNSLTLSTFLTWFGGIGYLLHYYTGLPPLPVDLLAVGSGAVGGGVVFYGMSKLYVLGEKPMDPAFYDRPGTVAKVSARIPADGTGEISYTKGGSSFIDAAKSAKGIDLTKGTEVVITKFEKGMAWVEPYEQFVYGERKETPELSVPDNGFSTKKQEEETKKGDDAE